MQCPECNSDLTEDDEIDNSVIEADSCQINFMCTNDDCGKHFGVARPDRGVQTTSLKVIILSDLILKVTFAGMLVYMIKAHGSSGGGIGNLIGLYGPRFICLSMPL